MTLISPADCTLQCVMLLWNHDSEFTKWQHPVLAPCNVIRGSGMACHWIRPVAAPCNATRIHLASESSARSLRSSSGRKCSVTRVHSRFGDRCFAAAGPRIWNNLSASLRDNLGSQLHRIQKTTENIHISDGLRRVVTFLLLRFTNTLTYLLTYLLM